MNSIAFAFESPLEVPLVHQSYKYRVAHESTGVRIAWEAPIIVPKSGFHAQTRYIRAVPAWENQAPENGFNLSTLLQVLDEVDEACVLTVRKIHKLGLNSAQTLREHFSQYGEVDRVMLLPSRPKSVACSAVGIQVSLSGGVGKIRPASMAFVVMRSRQPAIVARLNEIHCIEGHPVQVQKFRRDPLTPVAQSDDGINIKGPNGDNYAWLDEEASTTADKSPSVPRPSAKFID
jgi:hypothetical protein